MSAPAATQVDVPDIGDFTDVPIIEVHVGVGDVVEVDRHHVALAALTELAAAGEVDKGAPAKAIEQYGIDAERPAPWRM